MSTKNILIVLLCVMNVACSEQKSQLSEEEAQHKANIDSCFNLLVEAGAKWHQGDQVGKVCDRRYPTRPEQARAEIMNLLKIYDLVPQESSYLELLPDGDCRSLARQYVDLNDKAYHLNPGTNKDALLSEAAALDATVRSGSCVPRKSVNPS
jgi:hypothetical protein